MPVNIGRSGGNVNGDEPLGDGGTNTAGVLSGGGTQLEILKSGTAGGDGGIFIELMQAPGAISNTSSGGRSGNAYIFSWIV